MASEEKLEQEIQRLYESSAVRDDLNDSEAQVLLQWGEAYLRQCAIETTSDEEFEQRSKYMRQLMKGINRFVGQREFMDSMREFEQLNKVMKWLPHTGLGDVNQAQVAVNLPEDKSDMRANLDAILEMLTPGKSPFASQAAPEAPSHAADVQDAPTQTDETPKLTWHNADCQVDHTQTKPEQAETPQWHSGEHENDIEDYSEGHDMPYTESDTTYPSEQAPHDATDTTESWQQPGDERET
jgi:hypothetical protein